MSVCIGVPEQALGWLPLGWGLVVELKMSLLKFRDRGYFLVISLSNTSICVSLDR